MSRTHHQIDIAYPPGMLDVARLVNHLPIYATVGSPNELGDTSGPLFSIYTNMVEEDDNKRAERHQKVLMRSYFS